jgi:hypothetical protein
MLSKNYLAGLLLLGAISAAYSQNMWVQRNPMPSNNDLTSVAMVDTQLIAVGRSGEFLRSADGISWTSKQTGTKHDLYSVVWANRQMVAVGDSGIVMTSPDGVAWTKRISGTTMPLYSVVWADSQFVAVGNTNAGQEGGILTSPDGITWTKRSSAMTYGQFNSVTWTGTQFVTVGDHGSIFTSLDGSTWTSRTSGTAQTLRCVIWTGTQLVAVGDSIVFSSDGVKWTSVKINYAGLFSVTWTGKLLVTVGMDGITQTSSDGKTWIKRKNIDTWLNSIVWTGTQLIAVGGDGSGSVIQTSPDGITWVSRVTGSTASIKSVTWAGTQWVAVGGNLEYNNTSIVTSPDGITWLDKKIDSIDGITVQSFNDVGWTGTKLFAVGQGNRNNTSVSLFLTSTNGITWVQNTIDQPTVINSALWTGSQFAAIGGGAVLTSPDGLTWEKKVLDSTYALHSIAWTGSQLVVVGDHGVYLGMMHGFKYYGKIWTLKNGNDWALQYSDTVNSMNSITWTGSQLVAVGSSILTSSDGIAWTLRKSGVSLNALCWTGHTIVAVGNQGSIMNSTDGINWTTVQSGTDFNLYSIASMRQASSAECQIVAGGLNGTILTSSEIQTALRISPGIAKRENIVLRQTANKIVALLPASFYGKEVHASMYMINGKKTADIYSSSFTNSLTIPIHELARGTYIIEFKTSSMHLVQPFQVP